MLRRENVVVLHIWECEIKNSLVPFMRRLERRLNLRRRK
jgi:hypothetical protein